MRAGDEARFAADLNDCCQRVAAGESLDVCLAAYPPEDRAELARLVALTEPLRRLVEDPPPSFVARLERRLLAELETGRRERLSGAGLPGRRHRQASP